MLVVKNLSKTFHHKTVLKNISFSIARGECVALIGPNGAGKTTMFKHLLGDYIADSGNVLIDGLDARHKKLKEYVAILNQENAVPEKLKVREIISFYQSIYQNTLSDEEIDEILQFTPAQKNQLISKLSGGQKRFLVFVLKLIGKPKLLFLDEPTTAMDTATRIRFWEIIDRLKKQGLTIVYSSHYIEEVEHTADRILLLNQGELVKDGSAYQLNNEDIEKHFTVPRKYLSILENRSDIFNLVIKIDAISFLTRYPNVIWELLCQNACQIEEIEVVNQSLLTTIFTQEER